MDLQETTLGKNLKKISPSGLRLLSNIVKTHKSSVLLFKWRLRLIMMTFLMVNEHTQCVNIITIFVINRCVCSDGSPLYDDTTKTKKLEENIPYILKIVPVSL